MIPGINCDPDVYVITATVTADSANAVDESNEANNSLNRAFGPQHEKTPPGAGLLAEVPEEGLEPPTRGL